MSNGPKILFLDIETMAAKAYIWRTFKENIGLDQIIEPTRMICFAAKWKGKPAVTFKAEWQKGGRYYMLAALHKMLEDADFVVHWNGKRFDIPHINREFLLEGFDPPSSYKQIDLFQAVRSKLKLMSNKFEFFLEYFGIGLKLPTAGFKLWRAVDEGDKAARNTMRKYNITDTVELEPSYQFLLPWIPNHPNATLWLKNTSRLACPKCLSEHVIRKGIERPQNVMAYQRYKCGDCGAPFRGRVPVASNIKPEVVPT